MTRTQFEVLNVIVLKGTCRTRAVADRLALPDSAVEETVAALERGDLIGRAGELLLPTDAAEPALVASRARTPHPGRADIGVICSRQAG